MIPVKIQCSCGQRYAFDIEPLCGRMTTSVACPVCGADGTTAANEVIAFALARQLYHHDTGRQTVMIFAVIGCLLAGLAGIIKACNMVHGFDVLLCLVGAIGAFGMALCVYFWRR
jgi:UDP-N-acetylmuramyl pentapeptide phosphotransferase/UDP-N-acetylglucosamine-1-phosphate transferase